MRSLYTNFFNLYNLRKNLVFFLLFFLISCQIDQSVNLLKEKLFSGEEEINLVEEEIQKDTEKELIKDGMQESSGLAEADFEVLEDSSENSKINLDQQESSSNNPEISSIKKEIKTTEGIKKKSELAFKELGKARDTDSKIVSFFTKFFDSVDNKNVHLQPPVSLNSEKESQPSDLDYKDEVIIEKESGVVLDEQNDLNQLEEEFEEEVIAEDNSYSDSKENREAGLAFLQPKAQTSREERQTVVKKDDVVGLLLPLTGKKRAAGNLVLNSLRYSMTLRPNNLNFKIYDTKGDPFGAKEAAKKGIDDGVVTFIGPIFSDETRELKNSFQNKKGIRFFSLSPDSSNVSANIVVSGQNPEDQVSCIAKHISQNFNEKVLLIHHSGTYGYIIKNSLTKFIRNFGLSNRVALDYFEIGNDTDINTELKKISEFERRKLELKNEISIIKENKELEESEKKNSLKNLERKLTLNSPFDSIIIASEGDKLLEILSHLAFYDINSDNTTIYGTSLWEDTIKKDNVYQGAFYVTSLKNKNEDFIKSFKDVFSKDPLSFNFHIYDLINLIQEYKSFSTNGKEKQVFYGEFSNSKIKSGLLRREIYIKKIKKEQKTEEVFNCRLDVL